MCPGGWLHKAQPATQAVEQLSGPQLGKGLAEKGTALLWYPGSQLFSLLYHLSL